MQLHSTSGTHLILRTPEARRVQNSQGQPQRTQTCPLGTCCVFLTDASTGCAVVEEVYMLFLCEAVCAQDVHFIAQFAWNRKEKDREPRK